MNLRPHQIAAKAAILEKLDQGVGTQLAVLPTGTGKTFLASSVSDEFERTLFIAHRDELISQTVKTIMRVVSASIRGGKPSAPPARRRGEIQRPPPFRSHRGTR